MSLTQNQDLCIKKFHNLNFLNNNKKLRPKSKVTNYEIHSEINFKSLSSPPETCGELMQTSDNLRT